MSPKEPNNITLVKEMQILYEKRRPYEENKEKSRPYEEEE